MSVLLETSFGDIVIDLYTSRAPISARNFLKLCALKYYNDCHFFLVHNDFIIQTGDPANNGTGGLAAQSLCHPPGAPSFQPELAPYLTHDKKGTVSMARSRNGTHASQFFITLSDGLHYLDRVHTPFATVAEGMHVVDKISREFVDRDFRPYRIIRIRHTIILHDPFDDFAGMPAAIRSPEPAQGGHGDRLASDEEYDQVDDDARQERLRRLEEEREARSRAEVLEMIGDIADADLQPPENVLFVCKLNPVTEADDLEIIFSRFGECTAEILRDRSTGESLCYGFIEFENKTQCEKAYFKMDAALIDDRRIKVDFSQSVSKLWNAARRQKITSMRVSPTSRGATSKRPRLHSPLGGSHAKLQDHRPEKTADHGCRPQRAALDGSVTRSPRDAPSRGRRKKSRFDMKPT